MATTSPIALSVELISTVSDATNHNISKTTPGIFRLTTATNTYTTDVSTSWATTIYNEYVADLAQTGEANLEVRYDIKITDANAPVQTGVTPESVNHVQGYLNNPTSIADLKAQVQAQIAAAIAQVGY